MKQIKWIHILFLCAVVLAAGTGCIVVELLQTSFQKEDIPEQSVLPIESQPDLTMVQSEDQPEREQIIFVSEGNIWRYILDSGEIIQVTTGGVDEFAGRYHAPHLSPDGRYVAYSRGEDSYIQNLDDGDVIDLANYGQFFQWAETQGQFFTFRGDLDCDSLSDEDEETQLNYDIFRYDFDDISNPEWIANIDGGWRLPQVITADGLYAGLRNCYCFSQCGGTSLWHLPSESILSGPDGTDYGSFTFSPDGTQLVVTSFEPHLFETGELYVANIDFTNTKIIYSEANKVPGHPLWSPDGGWIAFTVVYFGGEDESEIYSQPMIIRPDGSDQRVIAENYAEVINWSPDGGRLLYLQRAYAINQVYVYHLETGNSTLLPLNVGDYGYMEWGRLP